MSTKYISSNWRLLNKAGVDSYKNDNYGLSFNGSNEFINFGNSDVFNYGDSVNDFAFSVSVWIYRPATGGFRILDKGSEWQITINGSNILSFTLFDTNGRYRGRSCSFTETGWNHIVCTYDGRGGVNANDGIKIYANNVQVDDTTVSNGGTYTAMHNLGNDANLGRLVNGTGYTNGNFSECAIFDYALSSTQINTLYGSSSLGAGNPMALPTPVAYYPLGDNSASNPLTQPNEAVEDASVFEFDGSNVQLNNVINLGTTWTISFWIKTTQALNSNGTILAAGSGNGFTILLLRNNRLTFYRGDATDFNYVLTGVTYNDDKWHNIVLVRNGTSEIIAHYDGQAYATDTRGTGNLDSKFSFIGDDGGTWGTATAFDGELSNIVFWKSDQTTEISNIYNSGVPATSYTNTPTAWYKLDQSANWDVSGSGNWTIPDASGNGNDGTSSGMTSANLVLSDLTRAVPYDNYSFKFDAASTDYFNCGSGIGTLIGENYTGGMAISLWFKADVTNSDDGLFKFNGASSFGEISMAIYNNNLELRIKGASEMTSAFTDTDSWHHLLINLIGPSGANQVYLDGVAIGSTFTYSSGGLDLNGEDLIIGYYYNTSYPFDGNINNFAVFDEALSTTEILKLYSNGTPQDLENFTPQPIGWYPMGSNSFWNGSQWIIRDMSTGGSNDGTGQNIGVDGLVGNSPRSTAGGTGTNMDIESNIALSTKWSSNNSISINMSSEARIEDTP
jgi:hypothetical protein